MTKTEQFDKALDQAVNTDRQKDYGHPLDHFAISARMKFLLSCPDLELKHAMEMICDKLARLQHSPEHLDSWIDIAGYARTAVMVLDEREARLAKTDFNHERKATDKPLFKEN